MNLTAKVNVMQACASVPLFNIVKWSPKFIGKEKAELDLNGIHVFPPKPSNNPQILPQYEVLQGKHNPPAIEITFHYPYF